MGRLFRNLGGRESDGARVVVGASGDDDQGPSCGSAYVLDGTTGERLLKLVASDGDTNHFFGYSVAVSSDGARVVVGACGDGSAYVLDGATGERLLKLVKASDLSALDRFGCSVAVSSDGARVVAGAYRDNDQVYNSGSAYGAGYGEPQRPDQRLREALAVAAGPAAARRDFGAEAEARHHHLRHCEQRLREEAASAVAAGCDDAERDARVKAGARHDQPRMRGGRAAAAGPCDPSDQAVPSDDDDLQLRARVKGRPLLPPPRGRGTPASPP
ncbi:unnamed protein product [Prorocentrum cordatum]|uniref:Uncharacterized protein n=1 Tax=Prorocentrum cordatum TaxID=2364126 RepID=A0ABN9T440_9DINO|nr:unnamed protein product [Polarella glacialis]